VCPWNRARTRRFRYSRTQWNLPSGNATPCDLLSVSLVVYRPHRQLLERTLLTLAIALDRASVAGGVNAAPLYIVNNGTDEPIDWSSLTDEAKLQRNIIEGQGNVGYGRGHNLAIERTSSRYHLILNPDIGLESDALPQAITFIDAHPQAGLLSPLISEEDGSQQYLCRRYSTVFDLFVRGFLPRSPRKPFKRRLARYEMRHVIDEKGIVWDPPIVSGCFMLSRGGVIEPGMGGVMEPAETGVKRRFERAQECGLLPGLASAFSLFPGIGLGLRKLSPSITTR
jgi:GT2 family glycosyltransferase